MPRKNYALPGDQQAKLIEILNRRLTNAIAETTLQLPDVSLQEADAEALDRWLDDGGASDNQAAENATFLLASFSSRKEACYESLDGVGLCCSRAYSDDHRALSYPRGATV